MSSAEEMLPSGDCGLLVRAHPRDLLLSYNKQHAGHHALLYSSSPEQTALFHIPGEVQSFSLGIMVQPAR